MREMEGPQEPQMQCTVPMLTLEEHNREAIPANVLCDECRSEMVVVRPSAYSEGGHPVRCVKCGYEGLMLP